MIEIASFHERRHLVIGERREEDRRGAGTDRRQQIVGVFGRQDQDQVVGRLFERLEQRIGGLIAGPIDVVDQKYSPVASRRFELRALFELAHLRNRNLPQRTVRRESHEIGMRREQQRIFIALLRRPFLPRRRRWRYCAAKLRSSCSILSALPSSSAPKRRARVAFPMPSGPANRSVCGMRSCSIIRSKGGRDMSVAPEVAQTCRLTTFQILAPPLEAGPSVDDPKSIRFSGGERRVGVPDFLVESRILLFHPVVSFTPAIAASRRAPDWWPDRCPSAVSDRA